MAKVLGKVESIQVRPKSLEPISPQQEVRAVAGMGIEGDHQFGGPPFLPKKPHVRAYQITLIEAEAVEALKREMGLEFPPAQTRRNLVTRGVPLNHLVDREFTIGEVRLRGIELDEPCQHLVNVTGERRLLAGLIHRGGLGADIIDTGTIRVGDSVTLDADTL